MTESCPGPGSLDPDSGDAAGPVSAGVGPGRSPADAREFRIPRKAGDMMSMKTMLSTVQSPDARSRGGAPTSQSGTVLCRL